MASIDKRPNGQWRARWREFPGGPQRTKQFGRKVDAERFLVDVQHRLLSGTYTPPSAGLITVDEYATEWLARRTWAPSTRDRVERELRLYILPALGPRPLSSLRRSHLEEWVRTLPVATSTANAAYRTLRALLAAAVEDDRIPRNPASGAKVADGEPVPFVPLTVEEVRAVAAAAAEHVRAAVVLAAGTGLRQGELFGLTVDRVDFLRRELRVDRQLWSPPVGAPVLQPPKSKRSYRTVVLSDIVLDVLSAHVGTFGAGEDGLLFHTPAGSPLGRAPAWRLINAATSTAGLDGRAWHDLRHHHASALLSSGVNPAKVAERLGHDLKTLLETYAHVMPKDDDRVRSIVDETLGGSAREWLSASA
jgi:integrase